MKSDTLIQKAFLCLSYYEKFVSRLVRASPLASRPAPSLAEETCGANLSLSELRSRGRHSATIHMFLILPLPAPQWRPPTPPPSPSLTTAQMQNVRVPSLL